MTTAPPRDFAVVLPADWTRLRFDESTGTQIVALVNRNVEALPAQHRESTRQTLTRALSEAVSRARDAGAVDLLMCSSERHGLPVSASCLVTHIVDTGGQLADLASTLTETGGEVTLVELPSGLAVRRRHIETRRPDQARFAEVAGSIGFPDPGDGTTRTLEVAWFLRMPGGAGILVFTFACTIAPLEDAMTQLFDAIAGTIRWVP